MKRLISLIFLLMCASSSLLYSQDSGTISTWLSSWNCVPSIRFTQHDYDYFNKPVQYSCFPLASLDSTKQLKFNNSVWQVDCQAKKPDNQADALDINFHFKLITGKTTQTSIAFDFTFQNWSKTNYVLMPAATYNGNRYESRRIRYSPKLLDPRDIGLNIPMIISDVPRLNINDGPSRIQERSGTMSVPAIGFHSDTTKTGFWLMTTQGNDLGDYGIGIEESRLRNTATISLTVPVVREQYKYFITDNQYATTDKAPDFNTGDEFSVHFRLYCFTSPDLQNLFDQFILIRKDVVAQSPVKPFLPFSACFEVQEEKFNRQNWEAEHGYYSVGMRENFLQDWQIGWTGGLISTYPLLFAGSNTSRENVIRNFDWLFPNGISPSGFFWDSGDKGVNWYGGDIRKPHTKNWHLVRKSGDGLYYALKQMMLMEKMNIPVNQKWKDGVITVSDAFVKLWNIRGQLGNFVDSQTGDVVVGGSTSGAIVPAALLLASKYFNNETYRNTAIEIADYYYADFVKNGITCGGPGDAMQNIDSESSYAMLESFMLVYETTRDKKWLDRTVAMANQFSTWVMPYDYVFPENSDLGKLGVQTTGCVGANTQNRHGAPGICTYSGIALWRLFRATGNPVYMELLSDIAKVLPQYLSHPLRPIDKMQIGWMSERVSTTDWLEGIGQLMYGSTWAETSLMLSFIELPGVYIQPDKSYLCVIDNIEAQIIKNDRSSISIKFTNPTKATAKVKVFAESSKAAGNPLGENALWNCQVITLKPGEVQIVKYKKN